MERFWSKVNIKSSNECWEWTAGKNRVGGYGRFRLDGKRVGAHRLSWKLHNGTIPAGMCVLHTCDNPSCVNPTHLFLGTHQDNMDDMYAKGRGLKASIGGEEHGNAKLTWDIVREIREAYPEQSQYQLAAKYNVCRSNIGFIVNNKRWVEE